MPASGLSGPYALNDDTIDKIITRTSAGSYALGETKTDGMFYIDYAGRSDGDVNGRLHDHAGRYKQFKYGYFPTAKAAFEKECNLYHDFSPRDNKVHPARSPNTNWTCPRCRALG